MTYSPFGTLQENRPRFLVPERLQHCATVAELARLAESKGYLVSVESGAFINDIRMHEGFDNSTPLRNHTVRSARRIIESHPGAL